jgi:thioesterase domain-containing protein
VPVGVVGELLIGGEGLARGYLNQPELTAVRFIPDPFSQSPGARLYRTGDLARYRSDGAIECLGRFDQQVKLRGYRIELGEIESVLERHPAVREAVAVVREDRNGNPYLAAYVVANAGVSVTQDELRAHAGRSLPDYMVPTVFMILEKIPLTPNGKVDRRALPDPVGAMAAESKSKDEVDVCRTLLEEKLRHLWQRLFDRVDVGLKDNFFDLGGHSLLATRLSSELEKLVVRRIPLAAIFQAPTVSQLARMLTDKSWAPPWSSLVPLQPHGSRPAVFFVHGWGGEVFVFTRLAKLLGADQPVYGVRAEEWDGQRPRHQQVEEMVAHYADEIQSLQPQGPYILCGWSLGGLIAYELGQQLVARGGSVQTVVLLDPNPQILPWPVFFQYKVPYLLRRLQHHMKQLMTLNVGSWVEFLRGRLQAFKKMVGPQIAELVPDKNVDVKNERSATNDDYYKKLFTTYRPRPGSFPIALFVAKDSAPHIASVWRYFARGKFTVVNLDASHSDLLDPNNIERVADALRRCLHQR